MVAMEITIVIKILVSIFGEHSQVVKGAKFDYDQKKEEYNYQAFYGLKHYNLLETESFLIRKLNQPTSCLMLQFKGRITLKLPFDSSFKSKNYLLGPLIWVMSQISW